MFVEGRYRYALVTTGIIALAVVFVYVMLGFYAHPSADDYCMAHGVHQSGLIPHLVHHYVEWSGRYASNTFYALFGMLFGYGDGYRLLALLMVVGLFVSVLYLLATVLAVRMTSPVLLLVSTGFLMIYLTGMREPAGSLYWSAGALTYQTANMLLLLQLALTIRLFNNRLQAAKRYQLMTSLTVVLVMGIGTHETNIAMVLLLVFVAMLFSLIKASQLKIYWLVMLVLALICIAIVFLSPGNLAREATFPMRHDWLHAINGSISSGLQVMGYWLSSPLLWFSTIAWGILSPGLLREDSRLPAITLPVLVITGLFTLLIPVVLQFPAWWAMGGYPPARTVDWIYFVFLISWFTFTTCVVVYLHQSESLSLKTDTKQTAILVGVAPLLLVVLLAMNGRFYQATGDLFRYASPYKAYMDQRMQTIDRALVHGQLKLAVPEYTGTYPRSIVYNDIRYDPRDWRNVCYADYYGLEGISRVKLPLRGVE